MKVLANDGIAKIGQEMLEKEGFTVATEKVAQENLIDTINKENYVALLVRSATTVRKDLIDACPGLQFIGRGGVGMDNIDVAYAREKGITVQNTPAASSQSVAELVMGHLFAISRSLHDSYKSMENGDFKTLKKKYSKGIELRGKTLGIIGFGRIGKSLASYALGCGMNVIALGHKGEAVDIPIPLGNGHKTAIKLTPTTDLDELLPKCDFLSLHVPKQADGALISSKEFDLMKDNVRIVNAARGGVIDEDALIQALDSGKVAACALDVYENEPNPRQDLLAHKKIACSPHIGAATGEAQDRIGIELAEAILATVVEA